MRREESSGRILAGRPADIVAVGWPSRMFEESALKNTNQQK
jgi:hypothetical protein